MINSSSDLAQSGGRVEQSRAREGSEERGLPCDPTRALSPESGGQDEFGELGVGLEDQAARPESGFPRCAGRFSEQGGIECRDDVESAAEITSGTGGDERTRRR